MITSKHVLPCSPSGQADSNTSLCQLTRMDKDSCARTYICTCTNFHTENLYTHIYEQTRTRTHLRGMFSLDVFTTNACNSFRVRTCSAYIVNGRNTLKYPSNRSKFGLSVNHY